MAKQKKEKNTEGRMTIWAHLGELRRRLTIIVISLLIATLGLYFIAPWLILFIIQPVAGWIANEPIETVDQLANVINVFDPLGGFTLRFKVSLFFGAIVTSPIWIWQIMGFFLPALKPNERKWVLPTFFIGVALFIFGQAFCYLVILSPAFEWMLSQTNAFANVLANATDYVNLILIFEIAFGFAFELPLIVFYLIVFNIVPYKKLRSSWRVVYVVLLVFCAVVTPDANPVTMVLMFVAIAALYEISLLVSRIVLSKRIKDLEAKQKAEEAGEEEDVDEDESELAKSKDSKAS